MNNLDTKFLQSELSRTIEMVQFADRKAGFVSVYYSAILGFLFTQKGDIVAGFTKYGDLTSLYALVFILFLTTLIIGLCHLFFSVLPRLGNHNTNKSLFYFGHIAFYSCSDYIKAMNGVSDDDVKEQLVEQIHANAKVADAKMRNVRASVQALICAVILLIILILLI